jgi:protein-ribulosamine 3-kinase
VSGGGPLEAALEVALGSPVVRSNGVAGGDINQAAQVALADGRELFVKSNPSAPPEMFTAEARGLAWLAEAAALRLPEVVAVSPPSEGVQFLVLQLIRRGRPGRGFDDALGRGLAALHRFGAPHFGLDHDNFIGRLPQANRPLASPSSWAEFYRQRRLEPQLRLAVDRGLASGEMRRGFQRLFAALDGLVGAPEPPARLHGDLWGGNLMCDAEGTPCLIDPAVYGGHREIDLAMMRLFGGFGPRVFAAYGEAWPLGPGSEVRVDLYQLYPLMVHVNLFGGGYVGSVEAALARIV